ncbi:MAG: hypothetical protein IPL70_13870 [Uliginosibacterium sp.]|nr:hypothetical protein [Uliginosibacterium sp.]
MTSQTRATLKGYFNTNDQPTEAQFVDLIDSAVNATDDPTAHVAITLDANADALLSLSAQALGLDTQAANRMLGGPATGAAAVPTFRALVDADIPALAATKISDFDTEVGNHPDVSANTSARHAVVTLGADADGVLGLNAQQITLDTQAANYVFAGPTNGAVAVPTFRALTIADLPITSLFALFVVSSGVILTSKGEVTWQS